MLAPIVTKDPVIELIENSGIQFLDYEFVLNFYDRQSSGAFETGYFLKDGPDDACFLSELERTDDSDSLTTLSGDTVSRGASYVMGVESAETLRIYNGVWIPLPYFAKRTLDDRGRLKHDGQEVGPLNWARARVVLEDEDNCLYRVVLAFDTAVQLEKDLEYFAPRSSDITNGSEFSFDFKDGGSRMLRPEAAGSSWVSEWAEAVFRAFAGNSGMSSKDLEAHIRDQTPQAHYLNMLGLLGRLLHPSDICLISRGTAANRRCAEVTLVLDIGNSRSCGTLVEHNRKDTEEPRYTRLELRDLNAPEHIYTDAFESSLEFSRPNFEFDGRSGRSGRSDAFSWPSIARTGHEAVRLAAMRAGNEGETGLSSPKRRLWDEDRSLKEWCFNQYSYQMPILDRFRQQQGFHQSDRGGKARPAYLRPLSDFINSKGDALFACADPRNFKAEYSGKSTMTFMLIEILTQALCQINSYGYRSGTDDKNTPRVLKALVLTYPPSMPDLERETFRGCAYEALGILWKCFGYDRSAPGEMDFLHADRCDPPLPELVLDWDEAEAAQIVYLYNESQRVFPGNNRRYLEFLRRPGADGRFGERQNDSERRALVSARVASVDIGGGTTDLVVTDYAIPRDADEHSTPVTACEVLREGFKTAGDDLLLEIMQKCVIAPLGACLDAYTAEHHLPPSSDLVLSSIFSFNKENLHGANDQTTFKRLCQQTVKQIFMKVGYRILAHLENLKALPEGTSRAVIRGSIMDFIKGTEQCELTELTLPPTGAAGPDDELFDFVNGYFRDVIAEFELRAFQLSVDLIKLNRSFESGDNCIAQSLDTLSALVALYKPDVLLLTGRPTRIPGIRGYFLGRTCLPASRIVRMADYRCGNWYPYTTEGSAIGDTKTTVAVGAAIAYLHRACSTYVNFTFDLTMPAQASPVRYVGHVDNNDFVEKSYYRFATENECASAQNGGKHNDLGNDGNRMQMLTSVADAQKDGEQKKIQTLDIKLLPDNLAYRQFSSKDYPATRLYTLETVGGLEEIEDLRAASALSFYQEEDIAQLQASPVLTPGERSQISALSRNYEQAKAKLNAESLPDETGLRAQFESEARERALARAREELKGEAPSGLLGRFKQSAYESRLNGRADELCRQEFSRVEEQVSAALEAAQSRARERLTPLQDEYFANVRKILNDHYVNLRNECDKDLQELEQKVQYSRSFEVKVMLDDDDSCPSHRLMPLWRELEKQGGVKLPPVFKLRLESAKHASHIYSRYVRLRLKTVSEDDYWTDSGQIYAGNHAGSQDFVAD